MRNQDNLSKTAPNKYLKIEICFVAKTDQRIKKSQKMSELERLTTATKLIITKATTSRTLNPCYTCTNVITKHHRELLDMQCLLVQVLTVKHMLKLFTDNGRYFY